MSYSIYFYRLKKYKKINWKFIVCLYSNKKHGFWKIQKMLIYG